MHSVEVLHTTMNDIPFLTERLHTPAVCFTRLHTLVSAETAKPFDFNGTRTFYREKAKRRVPAEQDRDNRI